MTDTVYCITGATGFLGKHLIRQLASNVRSVRCLSRKKQPPTAFIEWIIGDLNEERTLQNLIVKDSIVVNLAFDAAATRNSTLIAARSLGQACVKAHAQRLVHVSTATVVGRARGNMVDETTPCAPISLYEQTKLEFEDVLLAETMNKLCATVIRPTATFGEGGQNLIRLSRQVALGNLVQRRLLAYLHGKRCMNLVAVENVVQAISHLAMAPANVSQGVFVVSDDDAENNNYAYVESRLAKAFGRVLPGAIGASLPAPMLRLLLRMRGRSNSNPYRRYSCKKLLATGFTRPVTFEYALDDYAVFLATQWANTHTLPG
jgi:nucleoside-diphosphate-sugar epimerase